MEFWLLRQQQSEFERLPTMHVCTQDNELDYYSKTKIPEPKDICHQN
jgi:hypothetical protein